MTSRDDAEQVVHHLLGLVTSYGLSYGPFQGNKLLPFHPGGHLILSMVMCQSCPCCDTDSQCHPLLVSPTELEPQCRCPQGAPKGLGIVVPLSLTSVAGNIMEQILLKGILRHTRDKQVSKTANRASPKADHARLIWWPSMMV